MAVAFRAMRSLARSVLAALVVLAVVGCVDDDPTVVPPPGDVEVERDDGAAGPGVPPLLDGPDGVDHWDETQVVLGDGALTVAAKVADTDDRRRQGLMRVPQLPDDAGMLFLFDELRTGGFWMKDTLVPLDIAYLAEHEIVAILQMDPCDADPCPSYDAGVSYDAALEVRQGLLGEAGVAEGDPVTWTEPSPVG